jgi:cytochrome c-type biogenesis protein
MWTQIGISFLGGLLAFLSPCVLPLVPVYISYLGGRSATAAEKDQLPSRWRVFLHGLAFVLGFSLVYIFGGLIFSLLGVMMVRRETNEWIARIGGIIVIFFGLHLTGLIRIPSLEYELKPRTKVQTNISFISSFLLGIVFAAGWSACIGPILGSLLTMTLVQGKVWEGVLNLAVFSLGLAIPFLLVAIGMQYAVTLIRKFQKFTRIMEIISGVLMTALGVILHTGIFTKFIGLFS